MAFAHQPNSQAASLIFNGLQAQNEWAQKQQIMAQQQTQQMTQMALDSFDKLAQQQQGNAMAEGKATGAMAAIQQYRAAGIGEPSSYESFAEKFGKAKSPMEKVGLAITYIDGLENIRKTQINNAQIAAYGQRQQAGIQATQQQNAPSQPNALFQPAGGSWNNVR